MLENTKKQELIRRWDSERETPRDYLNSSDNSIESVFVEPVHDRIIIGCIYRPPGSDIDSFTVYIDSLLSTINKEHKIAFIAGYFNIDFLKTDVHVPTADYVNCLFTHCFFPVINRPTRISETSATLIDNILTNGPCRPLLSAIIFADISDHLPVLAQTNLFIKSVVQLKTIYNRTYSDEAKIRFINYLYSSDWKSCIVNIDDPNTAYSSFIDYFKKIFDSCFPIIKVNLKRKSSPIKTMDYQRTNTIL